MRAPVQKMRPRRKGKQTAPEGATPGATTPTERAQERTSAGSGPDAGAGADAAAASAVTDSSAAPAPSPAPAATPSPVPAPPVDKAPTARVRNRLIVAVAVVAAAVAGAGAPAVVAASGRLNDTQSLVTLAEQTQQAVSLGHSLADERDEVTTFIASGRPQGKGLSQSRSARVDRQIDELRDADAPAELRDDLADIAAVRREALTGRSTALEAHEAYSKVIAELHGMTRRLAEQLPPEANGGALALADLDHAVEQAAAARGLLLAALALPAPDPGTTTIDPVTGLPATGAEESSAEAKRRDELSAAAQQARVRELASLADFLEAASAPARATYESTVTGSEVTSAEKYLERLTDRPTFSDAERRYDRKKVDAALSARIETMRGAESALNVERTKQLAQLRDDDVTALEIRIALVGVCLLVAVGVAMGAARSLTRPLAVLRRGSARLATEPAPQEPIRFTGRDDEFAQVVRSVNALHGHAAALAERLATLESDRKHLIGQRQSMADERAALREELAEASAHLERVRKSIHGTFVNLALRTLGLVERQLAVIENLEDREQDPDRLATLFKLDHLATVMRRHSENLLVLAGAEHGHQHPGAVPLVDVVRAAVSEIERYERVRIATLPPHAHVAGFVADDISHLTAELLENATSFSPPDAAVEVSGWLLENGEVMLSVQDEGIGVSQDRMRELNARLTDFDPDDVYDQESGDGLGLGLYVVARLAARHGARVRLREQKQGGVAAVVVLPTAILAEAPSPAQAPAAVGVPPRAGETGLVHLPGSEAEANSNVIPGRLTGGAASAPGEGEDPLIAAAERTLETALPDSGPAPSAETTMELMAPPSPEPAQREAEPEPEPEPAPAQEQEPAEEQKPAQEPKPAPKWERVTDKGLPKRTPRITAPAAAPPKPRGGSVDADALRRRLGGFHQGAQSGRRDVEAELAAESSAEPSERNEKNAQAADVMGDSVEEASS
ncbi:nitrate- and nitrite sensing domain-containing protein [Streptomyces sp. NPDC058284]|uniref:sensor histidine kinase n=1 Tax=unclassified Streptomyces TaxID=2593676 RepID=UPI00365D2C7A